MGRAAHGAWHPVHLRFGPALDDPDNKGFWTTLILWNKWRHETYKDNSDGELQYLDLLL